MTTEDGTMMSCLCVMISTWIDFSLVSSARNFDRLRTFSTSSAASISSARRIGQGFAQSIQPLLRKRYWSRGRRRGDTWLVVRRRAAGSTSTACCPACTRVETGRGGNTKLDAIHEGRRIIVRVLDVTVALREGENGRESGIW